MLILYSVRSLAKYLTWTIEKQNFNCTSTTLVPGIKKASYSVSQSTGTFPRTNGIKTIFYLVILGKNSPKPSWPSSTQKSDAKPMAYWSKQTNKVTKCFFTIHAEALQVPTPKFKIVGFVSKAECLQQSDQTAELNTLKTECREVAKQSFTFFSHSRNSITARNTHRGLCAPYVLWVPC